MHCTLLIPDLLPPAELGAEPYAGLPLPFLTTMLARGTTVQHAAMPCEEWLCARFGVTRQQDHPLAGLMLKADGGEPGQHYWLCAEPIQLRVDRDRLIVAARVADYNPIEAAELISALNRHFNADGIDFCAPTPSRWYLRTGRTPALVTHSLASALNRSIKHHLPQGDDALAWHGVMNEAQMILHTHPVNEAREARGAAVANSIWLWGGGTAPQVSLTPYAAIWGGGPMVRALASAADIPYAGLPASASAWFANAVAGHALLVLDGAANALRDGDITGWREQLSWINAQWIQPLLTALRNKTFDRVTLIACNAENRIETNVERSDLWRIWRRARPLSTYTAHA